MAGVMKIPFVFCEYFIVENVSDTLYADEQGNTFLLSELEDEQKQIVKEDTTLKTRKVKSNKIKWYYLAGDEILDEKDWLGKYIPIVRVVGEEKVIEGKTVRKGHTRGMKDAQKMYNFWTSSAAEFVSLQENNPTLHQPKLFKAMRAIGTI